MFDVYLSQLSLTPPETPDVDFLNKLVERHVATYSFNNTGVLLRETLSLELSAILHKLVTRKAGGFCFEHNKLVMHCLDSLGYDTRLVMGRVFNNHIRDVPRTHRVTLVTLDGEDYLIDCGFGASVPQAPLKLSEQGIQQTGNRQYTIKPLPNGEYDVVLIKEGCPFVLYRIDSAVYSDADCTAGHLYSIAHPQAVFVNNLVVSINKPDQTHALINHTLTSTFQGRQEETRVTSAEQLTHILQRVFTLPVDTAICHFLFERYVQPHLHQDGQPAAPEQS